MVEAEQQIDALVEESLGFWIGGCDRMVMDPQAGEDRCAGLVGLSGVDGGHGVVHVARLAHAGRQGAGHGLCPGWGGQ